MIWRVLTAVLAAVLLVLAGCAETQVRRDAQAALARGDTDAAIRQLEAGVVAHPDSTPLRSALLQARHEALTRALSEAVNLRAQGRLDEADAVLQRAAESDPGNERFAALRDDVAEERVQQARLAALEAQVGEVPPAVLLERVQAALREGPRHAGLRALQRRLAAAVSDAAAASDTLRLSETRPITLDFRDASLRTVLDVVSRHSGVNFVIDRDVQPETRITVFLVQAQVEDALDLIVTTGQLAKKVVDARTIVVYPDTPEKRSLYQEQVVRVFHLASADAKGAAAFLRSMAGVKEPFVDERSNMLALRDTPENIRLAERLIALYDTAEPEVLLELEVLEVSSNRLTELGIKFPDTFSLTPLAPAGASGLTLGNLQGLNSDRIAVGVAGLLINLRREVGDFTTLANPRIRVRNREAAKVLVGDKIPVITTTTGTGGFVSDSVSYLDVGLKLDVEPTVYADDEVAIKVALEVSTQGAAVRTSSGTLAYQIGTRTASTLLRLRDGETQLLAGLISRDERSSASRVPGLGDLPVLGRLFSNQQDTGNRKELVLAITPRILRNLRVPDPSAAELWVGTEARPALRPPPAWRAQTGSGVGVTAGSAPAPGGHDTASAASAESAGALPPEPVASVPRLRWQGPTTVKVGEELTLQLELDSATPLRGLPMVLRFDPRRLALQDAIEGAFFRQDDAATAFTQELDAEAGQLRVGVLRRQATGAMGSGAVVSLRFRALAAGAARVLVDSARLVPVGPGAPRLVVPPPWTLTVQ